MDLKEELREEALRAGFCAFGVAGAAAVDVEWCRSYEQWLGNGNCAGMEYLRNHSELRSDPSQLLPGARSVISLAINYYHPEKPAYDASMAMYAHGDDYHEVARDMMRGMEAILQREGYSARLCVDTAPVRERYWALRSGVAFAGCNGLVIVPGVGSYCFLCEIITDAPLEPDRPLDRPCDGCMECVRACPGKAILKGGRVDARRCHSYLSIEHRGELPENIRLRMLYGCDECQRVCPHNRQAPVTGIERLRLRETLRTLTLEQVEEMTQQQFSTLFRRSAVKRAKLEGLKRNLRYLQRESGLPSYGATSGSRTEK